MKIPKVFHPILGVLTGTILFFAGIALLSVVFVGMVKAIEYAKPFFLEVISNIHLEEWLPL